MGGAYSAANNTNNNVNNVNNNHNANQNNSNNKLLLINRKDGKIVSYIFYLRVYKAFSVQTNFLNEILVRF